MKKVLLIALTAFGIVACGENTPKDPNAPTSEEKDAITLAFIKHVPKSSEAAVDCQTKSVNERYYMGCALTSVGNRGNVSIFLYNKDKDPVKRFYALNGTAMTMYDKYLQTESLLGNYKDTFELPMEKDIDLGAIRQVFEK